MSSITTSSSANTSSLAFSDEIEVVKPFWVKCVELPVVFIFKRLIRPALPSLRWIWFPESRRCHDQFLLILDTVLYWNIVINRFAENEAYPPVYAPEDLAGPDRIVWKLRKRKWWREKVYWFWLRLARVSKGRGWGRHPGVAGVMHGARTESSNMSAEKMYPMWREAYEKGGLDTTEFGSLEEFSTVVESTRPE